MLTGDIPFNSESYSEIVQKNLQGNIDFEILSKLKVHKWSKLKSNKFIRKHARQKSIKKIFFKIIS